MKRRDNHEGELFVDLLKFGLLCALISAAAGGLFLVLR